MASPENSKGELSYTSTFNASNLHKIMLLDRVMDVRNKEYEETLSAHMSEHKQRQSGITDGELAVLSESFTRSFYQPEFLALAEFTALEKERDGLIEKQQSAGLGKAEIAKLKNAVYFTGIKKPIASLNIVADPGVGQDAYVASNLFSGKTITGFGKQYSDINKQLNKEIREMGKLEFPELSSAKSRSPAIISLFSQKYPSVVNELKSMKESNNPALKTGAKGCMAMLKSVNAFANPSGFFISMAVGALMKTSPMQRLTKNIAVATKRASEKTGFTNAIRKGFSHLSDVSVKRISGGVAAGIVGGMLVMGLVEPEEAMEFAVDLREGFADYFGSSPDQAFASSDMSNTTDLDDILGGDTPPDAPDAPDVDAATEAQNKLMGGLDDVDDAPAVDATPAIKDVISPDAPTPGDSEKTLSDSMSKDEPAPNVVNDGDISPPIGDTVYTVVAGDTLSEIVQAKLQESGQPYNYAMIMDYVDAIAEQNDIADPDKVFPNQEIMLPHFSQMDGLVSEDDIKNACEKALAFDPIACTPEVAGNLSPDDPASESLKHASECTILQPVNGPEPEPMPPQETKSYTQRTMRA
jgi:hypothetical protein